MAVTPTRKLWTTDEYERMIEMGILGKDDRVELINGEILQTAPIGIRHAACVVALQELLHKQLADIATISTQNPIQLPGDSEPQPDIAVLKGKSRLYRRRRPAPDDVLRLIEVSDSTLAGDRPVKLP